MRFLPAVAVLVVPLVLACGGSAAPDLAAKKSFSQGGVSFDYPGNWSVESEGDVVDGIAMQTIFIETPNDGLFAFNSFEGEMDLTAKMFANELMSEMPAQMEAMLGDTLVFTEGTPSSGTRTILGGPVPTEHRAFTLTLFGVDVPHTVEVSAVLTDAHHVVMYSQASDENLALDQAGFELIYSSLKVD